MSKKPNDIAATLHISETEVYALDNNYNFTWYTTQQSKLNSILYKLGMNISRGYIMQDPCLHFNYRAKEQNNCARFYGNERIDEEWLLSGFASQAAKDKASGGSLIQDVYSARKQTEKAQADLEYQDMFRTLEDE